MVQLRVFTCLVVFAIFVYFSEAASINKSENGEVCKKQTPCGWAVYNRYTRNIEYFMKNECNCPPDKKCLRTDDDISITAYIYRCRYDN